MAHFIITPHAYATLHTLANQVALVCNHVGTEDILAGLNPLLDESCQKELKEKNADFIETINKKLNQNIKLPNSGWNRWTPENFGTVYRMLERIDCIDRGGCNGKLDFDGAIAAISIDTAREPLNMKRLSHTEIGTASYYGEGDGFAYKQTAYGLTYNPKMFTLAHRSLPPGTVVEVIYKDRKSGIERSALAIVTDKGPYIGNRKADLSPALFAHLLGEKTLPKKNPGLLKVTLRVPTENDPATLPNLAAQATKNVNDVDRSKPSKSPFFRKFARWLDI